SPPGSRQEARASPHGIMRYHVQSTVVTWTLGVQRQILNNTSLERRYLGPRATQLPVQARINTISALTAGLQPLPTFFDSGEVPAAILGGARLSDFENFSPFIHPEFSTMTAFPPIGGSLYHAASVDLNRRFARGFMLPINL